MEKGIELQEKMKAALRKSELLSFLTEQEFEKLLSRSESAKFSLGDLLPQAADSRTNILLSGKIRLLERFPAGDENNICSFEIPGDCWSDSWLHSSGSAIVMSRASEASILLKVEQALINELCDSNRKFAQHLEEMIEHWEIFLFLRQVLSFKSIAASKLRAITRYLKKISLSPESLLEQNGLFLVASGLITGLAESESETFSAGRSFIQGTFGPFKGNLRQLSANAPSELIAISAADYMDLLVHSPDLAQELALAFERASSSNQDLQSLHLETHSETAASPAVPHEPVLPPAEDEPIGSKVNRFLHQYPIILQQSQMDCGITCLAMVALFYGKRLDINELRERAGVSVEGTSLLALAETAEHMGFMARGIRGTYEGLLNAKLPLICFWKQNHFVVLYEINEHQARIGDPAEGLVSVSRDEFTRDFSKSALELVPTVELKRAPGAKNPLTVLLPLLKPYGPQIRDVLAAGIVYQALMIITPFFSQTIIDRVIVHEDISMLNMLLLGMILVTGFQSALSFARGILISTLSTKIDHALFVQFFKHLLSLPLKYFEQRSTGDILARFNENARITAFLSGNTITVLLDAVMAIVYIGVLFYYNWTFGLATVFYIVLLMAAVSAYTPLLRGYSNEIFKKNVANDSCVIETVHGIEKIKSAAAESRTRWKWEILFVDKLAVQFKQQLASNGYSQVTQLVHLVGRILLMWLGANLVISKTFTVGQYMAANMMSGMAVDPVMRLISMWQQVQSVNISLERLGDVFRAQPEQMGQKTRMPEIRGLIELRNVTFRYNEHASKNTILNLSLRIQPNQLIAIVGRSGCGKTTLARLIQGLYLPSSGAVLIDGVDTSQIELSDLRKNIGVVAQQEFFFTGTIRENVAFYKPDADIEEIITVAKIAGIHEKVKTMGSGYDTLLTEGGINLSGGERQRLAIARALLHSPRILIFDEATSALDSESERHIQACMDLIRKGRTFIVVAHRLSTIKSADLIIVMDQGQIVEAGNHAALLEKKGLYFHLCSQQSI
ncbi:MAG: peptidase domain-containing ABC transporter [Candidatus Obscuribacterales bacterium]|nr:peptidase domain-containing ABC transporter [Candidatus Obscuribacterales bacterium]